MAPDVHPTSVKWIIECWWQCYYYTIIIIFLFLISYFIIIIIGALSQAATEADDSFRVLKMHRMQLLWSVLPEKAIDNAVKDYHKRPGACLSANGRHFEHVM